MKKIVLEFLRRGCVACGSGPIILAILYLILQQNGLQTLSVQQVSLGIFSLSILAFIAGGMNVIYHVERLPLMAAILIHSVVLYVSYLVTYLINGWLEWGVTPILAFSIIFLVGYLLIWAAIYCIIRKKTRQVNELLKKKQQRCG